MAMVPYKEFHFILDKLIAPYGILAGVNILNDNFRITWRTVITLLVGVSFPCLYIWAIFDDFQGDLGRQAIAFAGIGIQYVLSKKNCEKNLIDIAYFFR